MITFVISGLWHGANWTFVIWGAVHGAAQIIENIFTRKKHDEPNVRNSEAIHELTPENNEGFTHKKNNEPHGIIWLMRVLMTFTFCMFAWVFFRANNLNEAFYVFSHIFDGLPNLKSYILTAKGIGGMKRTLVLTFTLGGILALYDFFSLKLDTLAKISSLNICSRWLIYNMFTTGIFLFYVTFAVTNASFVYFQF